MDERNLSIEVENTIKVLRNGGVILYPTDTIWGIGCDATDDSAIRKIYEIKRRDKVKSFIVLVSDVEMLKNYVLDFPPIAEELLSAVDTPLTVIYPKGRNLSPLVYGPDGSVGIRMIHNPFCESLIKGFAKPIVSSSANLSGDVSPTHFQVINEKIKKEVDHICTLPTSMMLGETKASRIIKLESNGMFSILRN